MTCVHNLSPPPHGNPRSAPALWPRTKSINQRRMILIFYFVSRDVRVSRTRSSPAQGRSVISKFTASFFLSLQLYPFLMISHSFMTIRNCFSLSFHYTISLVVLRIKINSKRNYSKQFYRLYFIRVYRTVQRHCNASAIITFDPRS